MNSDRQHYTVSIRVETEDFSFPHILDADEAQPIWQTNFYELSCLVDSRQIVPEFI